MSFGSDSYVQELKALQEERDRYKKALEASAAKPGPARRIASDALGRVASGRAGGVHQFENDDKGYLAWIEMNQDGFVINCNADYPYPNGVTIHRATCHTISGRPANGRDRTVDYKKVCGNSVRELDRWAEREADTGPHRCSFCLP
jgi:hypothetical protein